MKSSYNGGASANSNSGQGGSQRPSSNQKYNGQQQQIPSSYMQQYNGGQQYLREQQKLANQDCSEHEETLVGLRIEFETLKMQIKEKDKLVEKTRSETTKIRKENFDLRHKLFDYKIKEKEAQADAKKNAQQQKNQSRQAINELQRAMQQQDAQRRQERDMMRAMMQGNGAAVHNQPNSNAAMQEEEERLLQRAMEESMALAQNNGQQFIDPDNMTEEQMLALDKQGGGCTREQIQSMRSFFWYQGKTQQEICVICYENFTPGKQIKILSCKHECHSQCIDKWLKDHRDCPVCNTILFR